MNDENILIFSGFLDLFSVSMFINVLPLHVKSFNVSTTAVGIFLSLYGALQILSGYLMGYLADRIGQKLILCCCALFSGCGYIILGLAPSFYWLFVARLVTGLFKQTQTLSRTVLSTKEFLPLEGSRVIRVKMLGRFSTLSSIGFIFGPPIGGYVYEFYGFFHVSVLTGIGFFTMFLLMLNLDCNNEEPLSHKNQKAEYKILKNKNDNLFSLLHGVWDILLAIFLLSFSPLLFRTNYSLTLKELFKTSGTSSGFATSFGALTGSIAGLVVPYIITFYRGGYFGLSGNNSRNAEAVLLFHTSIILGLSIFGCGLSTTFGLFVLFQTPISFVNGLSREAFNVIITRRVPTNRIGRIMGLNGSLVAFARLICPIVGGLLQEFSYRLPAITSGISSFMAAFIIFKCFYE